MPDRRMATDWSDRSPSADFWYTEIGLPNLEGIVGGENAHLFVSTSFAATRLLCGIGSTMPLNRTQTTEEDELTVSRVMLADPIHELINCRPNPDQTAISFRSMMIGWQVNRGVAFAEIQRDLNTGRAFRLWPIHPSRMTPFRNENDGGALWWWIRNKDKDPTPIRDTDLLRIPYIIPDASGLLGLGVSIQAARAIGLAQTLERTETTASKSSVPRIAVESPKALLETERTAFRREWRELYVDSGENLPALIGGGATIKPLPWSAVDTDHRARREFTIEELARWYDVPLTLLRRAIKETAGNVEQLGQEFQTYSLKFLEIWEQELDYKLLTEDERREGQKWQNDYKHLLRANHSGRADYYSRLFPVGGLTPNQIMVSEGMNPSKQDGADDHYIQGAMRKLSDPYKSEQGVGVPGVPEDGKRSPLAPPKPGAAEKAVGALLAATHNRMAKKEANAVCRAASKPNEFTDFLDEFYAKHEQQLAEALEPIAAAAVELGMDINAARDAREWCASSKVALVAVTDRAKMVELSDEVAKLVGSWGEARVSAFVEGTK